MTREFQIVRIVDSVTALRGTIDGVGESENGKTDEGFEGVWERISRLF